MVLSLRGSSLEIEIKAFALTAGYDGDAWYEIRGEVLLRIKEIVAASGTDFALPSRTLYFPKGGGSADGVTKMAAGAVMSPS